MLRLVESSDANAVSKQLARQLATQNEVSSIHQSKIYLLDQSWVVSEMVEDENITVVKTDEEFETALLNPSAKRILIRKELETSVGMVEEALKAQPLPRLIFMEQQS
jgi:hypothetical protein